MTISAAFLTYVCIVNNASRQDYAVNRGILSLYDSFIVIVIELRFEIIININFTK